MTLRPALPGDFAFIRSLAQRPDFAPFITDEDEAALSAYLTDPDARLLIWQGADGAPAGFALLCGLASPARSAELRRLALAGPGRGAGLAFVRALTDHAFTAFGCDRLWLDASGENLRAQTVYRRAGFAEEGRLRRHWFRPSLGRVVDLVLFGMLREEWAALPPAGSAGQHGLAPPAARA